MKRLPIKFIAAVNFTLNEKKVIESEIECWNRLNEADGLDNKNEKIDSLLSVVKKYEFSIRQKARLEELGLEKKVKSACKKYTRNTLFKPILGGEWK